MLTILALLLAFSITILILPTLISFLISLKIGDQIDERRIHRVFIPTAGGIGVIMPTLLVSIIYAIWMGDSTLMVILACISFIFITGFFDDLFDLKPLTKLLALIFPAFAIIILTDLRLTSLHGLFGYYELPISISYALTILVVVFITNAFNLIDGIDGLLSVISSFVFAIFGIWFILIEEYSYAILSFAFLGSILGFLIYNWHPAKIFLGDSGSLAIGFTVSLLALLFLDTNKSITADSDLKFNAPVALSISLLIIPIFDTLRVFFIRILNRESPFSADRRHLHHFLLSLNLCHKHISLSLLGFNLLMFVSVLFSNQLSDSILIIIVTVFLVVISIGIFVFVKINVRAINNPYIQNSRYKVGMK